MKNKFSYSFLGLLLLSSVGPCFFNNYGTAKAETNTKSSQLSNLNTSGTIFEPTACEDIKDYYSSIKIGDKGDSLLDKLQIILKNNQAKVRYDSGARQGSTGSGTAWNGYYLYERNYALSPLTSDELSGTYKKTGIWLNSLYSKSPIYICNSINNGDLKYYSDWSLTTESGSNLVSSAFESNKSQFDREHVFPKSFGFNGSGDLYKDLTAGCDAHNLHTGEHVGNSNAHNNRPYGNVANKKTSTAYYSGITGELVGYVGNNSKGIEVYEPNDEDKGDIARACFYMAARYHNYEVDPNNSEQHTPALTLSDDCESGSTIEPEGTATIPCAYGELSDFLAWNIEDPVDDIEIMRNDLIYNSVQYNRNPFIDFPSWAEACFADGSVKFNDINIKHAYLGEELEEFEDPGDEPSEDETEEYKLKAYLDEDTVKYLRVYVNGDTNCMEFVDLKDSATTFTYNEQFDTLTFPLSGHTTTSKDDDSMFLGTYSSYSTLSACSSQYLKEDSNDFFSHFYSGSTPTVVESPVVGTKYKLGLYQGNLSKNIFANGEIDQGKYLVCNENYSSAIEFELTNLTEDTPDEPPAPPIEPETIDAGFAKFTAENPLKVGDKVVFTYTNDKGNYSMSKTQNANNRGIDTFSFDEDKILVGDNTEIFTVREGSVDDTFAFETEDEKYIYAAGGDTENYLRTQTGIDINSSFLVSYNDNGTVSIAAQNNKAKNLLQYNSSAKVFSCYASTSKLQDTTLYGYTPDSFMNITPKANLSLTFMDSGEGNYHDFKNVSINALFEYDVPNRDANTYQEIGVVVEKEGSIQDYSRNNYFSSSLPEGSNVRTLTWKDDTKDSYIVSVSDIPFKGFETEILFVGYIKINNVYYYTSPISYSVCSLLEIYKESTETVNYDGEDVSVASITEAFINEINEYKEA